MDERTVAENGALPLRLRHWRTDRVAETIEAVRSSVGLLKRMGRVVGKLLCGEKQRVALARALCPGPEVLLADEPTAALDTESQRNMVDCLWALREQETTSVVITHDEEVAQRFDRQLILANGGIEGGL